MTEFSLSASSPKLDMATSLLSTKRLQMPALLLGLNRILQSMKDGPADLVCSTSEVSAWLETRSIDFLICNVMDDRDLHAFD